MHWKALGFTRRRWNVLGGIEEHGRHGECCVWGRRGTRSAKDAEGCGALRRVGGTGGAFGDTGDAKGSGWTCIPCPCPP